MYHNKRISALIQLGHDMRRYHYIIITKVSYNKNIKFIILSGVQNNNSCAKGKPGHLSAEQWPRSRKSGGNRESAQIAKICADSDSAGSIYPVHILHYKLDT